jgi:Domain of unknown function (DUF4267)
MEEAMADTSSSAYWRSPAILLAALFALAIVALALRTMFDPVAVSASFGLPMTSRAETSFVQVYGARNLVLGLLALAFIALRMPSATALVFTSAALLPPMDIWIVISRIGVGPELTRHVVIFAALLIMAAVLWRRAQRADATGLGAA